MQLIYHPEAGAELIAAAGFYQGRVPGLGTEFLEAVDQAASVIQSVPDRWRIVAEDVRRYLMPRFPYALYYRVLPDHLRILAVKHHSRRPDYWYHRLSERV